MVQIRTLQPSVKIALPSKPPRQRPSRAKTEPRRRADHPAPTPQPTPCVLWQGTVDDHGYGTWWRRVNGQWVKTRPHRWIVEVDLGRRLRDTEVILHACDQPLCFRLDHLSVGTRADNNADMMRKGRYKHGGGKLPWYVKRRIVQLVESGLFYQTVANELEISLDAVRRTMKEHQTKDAN